MQVWYLSLLPEQRHAVRDRPQGRTSKGREAGVDEDEDFRKPSAKAEKMYFVARWIRDAVL